MKTLRVGLPLVLALGWGAAAGCDDNRGVVDLGAGGDAAQRGGSAGEVSAAGEETAPGGAGGAAGGGTDGGDDRER